MLRAAIRNSWLAPTLFAAAVCFSHIHQGTIAVDAIRYSAIASNILESGDWIHLYDRFTESAYANKPPLLFWSLAGIFHTVGFSTFAAKFPAVLFTFLSMLLVWRIWTKLGGEAAGLWAILLFAVNRSFFRDLVELGFDGMAVCGAALCFLAAVKFLSKEGGARAVWLLFGCGLLLIFQSKPPYAVLTLLPIAVAVYHSGRFVEVLKSPGCWLSLLVPVCLVGAWFAISGGQYFAAAVDNQLAEPLRQSGSFSENLLLWVRSLGIDFAPLSVCGAFYAARICRSELRAQKLNSVNLMFLVVLLLALPIMLVVAQRGRYLWIPMLGALHFSALGMTNSFPRVTASVLKRALFVLALAAASIVILFKVPVHRNNALLELIDHAAPGERTKLCFCVDGDMPHRNQRMARYSALLLRLQYGLSTPVQNSEDFAHGSNPGCHVIAESNCLEGLKSQQVPYKILQETRGAALLELGASSPAS
ncbi:MAG: glycosyltransferase family 39 protein [Bdellovibrionales bacterium]|nr:glycosyltransferase family 39 protein [Bdellovibrionales bacterium]